VNNTLLSVEEARARILAAFAPAETEEVALAQARGRALAEAITATRDQPPGAVSAMDGYAVIAADLATPGAELPVVASIAAGAEPGFTLQRGEAARIFTGALLPEGADTVIAQEDTEALDGYRVRLNETLARGRHVRQAASDFAAGATLIPAGRMLDARDLATAAAANAKAVRVRRRPRVAILATGNELVPLGGSPKRHQIIASTGIALAAAIEAWGGEAMDLGIALDNESEIAAAIERGGDADLLVTLGGASVGEHDLVQAALSHLGFELGFWKIAMKPGKPLIFGRLGRRPIIGLPGNPVSSLICALIFIRPALRHMLALTRADGTPDLDLPTATGILTTEIGANRGRLDFLRGALTERSGEAPQIRPFDRQDSNQLSILSSAQCLIPRAPFAPISKEGAIHTFIPLSGLF
jgi:molybdopterin molybdotransferase